VGKGPLIAKRCIVPERMKGSLTSPVRAVRQAERHGPEQFQRPVPFGQTAREVVGCPVAEAVHQRSGGGSAEIVFNTPQTVQVTAAGLGLMLLLGSGVLLVVVKACSRIGSPALPKDA
jgi:hypothetical protein